MLIVGAGPVGLSLGIELGWRGVDCVIIDQTDGTLLLPRASGITPRTMEFCRRWGIADEVIHGGFPDDFALDTIYCTSVTGYLLGRHAFPPLGQQTPLPFSPVHRHRLPQHLFDPILEAAARRYEHVSVVRKCRLVGFCDEGDAVVAQVVSDDAAYNFDSDNATVRRLPSTAHCSPAELIRARYMVACDGVMSGVRNALGVHTESIKPGTSEILGYSISALVSIPSLRSYHDKGDAERYIFIGTEGVWGNLTTVDGGTRWRFSLAGTREKLDLQSIDMAALLRRGLGRDDIPFEIEKITPWRRRQSVTSRMRLGSVFLAGDAAHAMSPTGGFGVNTGIADAVDLGWKLSAYFKGWGGQHLLDSYESERLPVGRQITAAAASNYKPWHLSLDYQRILDPSPDADAERQLIGEAIKDAFSEEFVSWGVTMGYQYEESPICVPDGTAPVRSTPSKYEPTARPGARAPHAWLKDGRSTLDLFGHGFTLLSFDSDERSCRRFSAAAAERGVPLHWHLLDEPEAAALYEAAFALVRPDGHVAWRGDSAPEKLEQVIDRVRGAV